ncbi:MmpS family transport accessory protein [Micromonospora sp. NPDC049051]|uniref:MmpS family transport accessory protein n=1 Tax=Micromonospora sp. NPDC049051 TaxID=3364264 RepID=UPI00371C65BE
MSTPSTTPHPHARRLLRTARSLALLAALATSASCTAEVPQAAPPASAPPATASATPGPTWPATVVYEATGTGLADIEYFDAAGQFRQLSGRKLPWRLSFVSDGSTQRTVVVTQRTDDAPTMGCRVTIGGVETGPPNISNGGWRATCTG